MSGNGSQAFDFKQDGVLPVDQNNSVKVPGMFEMGMKGGKRKSKKMKGGDPMEEEPMGKEEPMGGEEGEPMGKGEPMVEGGEGGEPMVEGGEEEEPVNNIEAAFEGGKKSKKSKKLCMKKGSMKKGGKKSLKKSKKENKKKSGKKSQKKVKFVGGGLLPLQFSEFAAEAAPVQAGGNPTLDAALKPTL